MDFYNKFKSFIGISPPNPQLPDEDTTRNPTAIWEPPFDHNPYGRNFKLITDPLEIQRYFEQHMEDMLRSFGLPHFAGPFNGGPQTGDDPREGSELRHQFLKPSYAKPKHEKIDEDVDDQFVMREFTIEPPTENAPTTHFSSQSFSSKTIRNPDGSIESHRTSRDSQGNEETTITRKLGDQEVTVIKRRDKDGKEEITENLVNIDEKDASSFLHAIRPQVEPPKGENLFDKFFK